MPSLLDFAALLAHVDNDQRGGAGAITDVNKLDVPPGWSSLKQLGFTGDNLNTNPFSFTAGAYINASGEIVIAYKGTDFLTSFKEYTWH
jgi:hypothetical protein